MEIITSYNGHANNLLMSYLPKEKLLMITDIFNDFGMPRPNDPTPGLVSPSLRGARYAAQGIEAGCRTACAVTRQGRGSVQPVCEPGPGKVQAPAPRPIDRNSVPVEAGPFGPGSSEAGLASSQGNHEIAVHMRAGRSSRRRRPRRRSTEGHWQNFTPTRSRRGKSGRR